MIKKLLAALANRDIAAPEVPPVVEPPPPAPELEPHEKAHIELAKFLAADIQANGHLWDDGWNSWLRRRGACDEPMTLEIRRDSHDKFGVAVQNAYSSRQFDRLADKAQEILAPVVLEHIRAREQVRMQRRSEQWAAQSNEVLAQWKLHVSA